MTIIPLINRVFDWSRMTIRIDLGRPKSLIWSLSRRETYREAGLFYLIIFKRGDSCQQRSMNQDSIEFNAAGPIAWRGTLIVSASANSSLQCPKRDRGKKKEEKQHGSASHVAPVTSSSEIMSRFDRRAAFLLGRRRLIASAARQPTPPLYSVEFGTLLLLICCCPGAWTVMQSIDLTSNPTDK